MDNQFSQSEQDLFVIDLKHLFKVLWQKIWVIILTAVIGAVAGFGISNFVIAPKYSASIMLYVNNSSISLSSASFSISASEISAAQSLVKTYMVILNNRTTLETVIDKVGLDYTYEDLSEMITSESVSDTEIMRVTVTSENPYEASKIANCIAVVLPVRIAEIIKGSSMEVVDAAVPDLQKVSPSVMMYTAVGMILALMLCCGTICLKAILDDTIHDEDYVIGTYNYPMLAVIPDLLDSKVSSYYGYGRNSANKKQRRVQKK